jgi:hypothetical protein
MLRQALLIGLAASGLSACAWGYDGYYGPGYNYPYGYVYPNGYNYFSGPVYYRGTQWTAPAAALPPRQPYTGELSGPGVATLDEWLRDTTEGRAIVTLGFRDAINGVISEEVAHRANLWFRHYADYNRDMTITDEEIRTALVSGAGRYLPGPTADPAAAPAPVSAGR